MSNVGLEIRTSTGQSHSLEDLGRCKSQIIKKPFPCPSVVIDMSAQEKSADCPKKHRSLYPSLPHRSEDTSPSPKQDLTFPSLKKLNSSDQLDPSEESDLEEEAARYHNPDWPQNTLDLNNPPPYPSAPNLCALAFPLQASQAKESLSKQVADLKEVLSLQKQYADLFTELSSLQKTLKETLFTSPPQKYQPKPSKRHRSSSKAEFPLGFPVKTRQRAREARSSDDDSTSHEDEESDQEEDKTKEGEYKRLKFKLRDLNNAVRTYGPTALFTMSMLEALSGGGYLTTAEWFRVTQAVLPRGKFLSWKADFMDRCRTLAAQNQKNPRAPEAAWTFDKLTGQGKYLSESRQLKLPTGLLAQVKEAALGAWRAVPPNGSLTTPLTKIIQGPQEPYRDFVARLLEMAERVLGPEEADGKFLKQVAYENANSACKAVLRGHTKSKTLDDFVRLCADVDAFSYKIAQSIHLAVRAALQAVNPPPKGCFKCGQLGHFARQCPKVQGSRHPSAGPTNAPMRALNKPMPATVCPKCKRGKHWANQCRSKTDAFGNPLTPSWKRVEGPVQGRHKSPFKIPPAP